MVAIKSQPKGKRWSFAPGARIRVRDEEWIVKRCTPIGNEHAAIRCVGASELVRSHEAIFLTELEKDIIPIEVQTTELIRDTSPQHRNSRLYLEALLRKTPPTSSALHVGHLAALKLSEYQLRPADMALKALRPRLLIADGVGLGKTVEIGILLSELIIRGRGDRILVVAMKSMLEQFQRELWTRFTIPLVRLDSEGLRRVRDRIPSGKNPFHYYKRAIISIDTLKNDLQYRPWLEKCAWDAVVMDECHNAVNVGTGRHRVAELLASRTDALILASATPHSGRAQSFANLMHMLDPTAIANPDNYGPEDIRGLYVRRFRKDVEREAGAQFPERDPKSVWCDASPAEDAVLAAIAAASFVTLDRRAKLTKGGRAHDLLYKTTLLKAFLSSPQALLETAQARVEKLRSKIQEDAKSATEFARDAATLESIIALATKIGMQSFSKLLRLLDEVLPSLGIQGKSGDPRLVIFSERLATLDVLRTALADRLGVSEGPEKHTGSLAVITGAERDTDIAKILKAFSTRDGKVRVLLASDMASEGINLHHLCSRLVHFDVPWSFITLQQRDGRIDRFGQTERPTIRYLLMRTNVTEARGDIHVVEKLIERAQTARKNLGDEAALLGMQDAEREAEGIATIISEKLDLESGLAELRKETAAENEDGDAWLLRALSQTADSEAPVIRTQAASLYSDDLALLRHGLEVLESEVAQAGDGLHASYHPTLPEMSFRAPSDLLHRFEHMPREARPEHGLMRLAADRLSVQTAIEESRDGGGGWPEVQLLWPLHPVLEWLTDRLAVRFGRNEAPVLVLPRLEKERIEALALMQGILFNRRGQPVVTTWFGLPTSWQGPRPKVGTQLSLEKVIEVTGIGGKMANAQRESSVMNKLEGARPVWAQAANEYMGALREQRRDSLLAQLNEMQQRLSTWEERRMQSIDARRTALVGANSGLLARQRQRLDEEDRRVQARRKERQEWLNDTLATAGTPFLKLAAVFVAK